MAVAFHRRAAASPKDLAQLSAAAAADRVLARAPTSASRPFSPAALLLLGSPSKILATLATYPLQTMRTLLSRDGERQEGLLAATRTLVSTRGVSGFFDGLELKIVQTSLTKRRRTAGQGADPRSCFPPPTTSCSSSRSCRRT